MSGTRGGVGRIAAMGIALAVLLVLAVAGEARAAKYSVAQCGWFVGADADWADNTGATKFRPDSFCVPPPGSDPFEGMHFKSLTREGQAAVAGTHFARWRWTAPAGTGITKVRASWWHALHDGLEQRIGAVNPGGGFDPFASAASTDTTPTEFVAGFAAPMPALEDRLLCARAESKSCSLAAQSWSALRALTITIEDPGGPAAAIAGDLVNGGWRRGAQGVVVFGSDGGSGVRFGEATLDGARVAMTEFPCNKAEIGGEWRGTTMRPCLTGVQDGYAVDTTNFSDGPHDVAGCVADFAGNSGCTASHPLLIDNNAPAHPRSAALAGGEGWQPHERLRPRLDQPRSGSGESDRRRFLAADRPQRLRLRRPLRRRPGNHQAERPQSAGGRRLPAAAVAPRRGRQRGAHRRRHRAVALR